MNSKMSDVIIIGAGISGLSAAYHLKKNNIDIKVISENVGGRVTASKEGNIQYGAYYVMDIYKQVKRFITIGRRIRLSTQILHKRNRGYQLFTVQNFKYLPQAVKFYFLLKKFKKHYTRFQRQCLTISQIEAIKNDKYLCKLYNQNAFDFATEQKVKEFSIYFVEEALHATTFSEVRRLSAFTYLQFSLPLIVPIYEFTFHKDRLTKDFINDIITDTVVCIEKTDEGYKVTTNNHAYFSKNVIVATPPSVSQKILKLQSIKGPALAHMFHIAGKLKEHWKQGGYNLFSDENAMLTIAVMSDGTFLFYSANPQPNFEKYFYEYKILTHKFWNPAFNIDGHVLWETNIDKGLFLIGDHNVCGIEDSFITGVYAANEIMKNRKR